MAKEKLFRYSLLWKEPVRHKQCNKCNLNFKEDDLIYSITFRHGAKSRTRYYHKACWEMCLY